MSSVKKIEKALGKLDEMVIGLDKARMDGFEEVGRNNDKITSTIYRSIQIRAFINKIRSYFDNLKAKRIIKLENKNTAIMEVAARANRVQARLSELLK